MANPVYSISKFDETFVKADNRKSKVLHWVSLPVDLTGDGYQTLVEENPEEAAMIYGGWCAIVCVAAKCHTPGVLANSKGGGFSIARIASLCFLPESIIKKTIEWASSSEIGWLEVKGNTVKQEVSEPQENPSRQYPDDIPTASGQYRDNIPTPSRQHPDGFRKSSRLQDKTVHNNTRQNIFTSFENDCIPSTAESVFSEFVSIAKPIKKSGKKFPVPESLTSKRRDKIATRLKEPGWLIAYRKALEKLPLQTNKWQPSLDWLLENDTNAHKLAEGEYDNWKDDKNGTKDINTGAAYTASENFGSGF